MDCACLLPFFNFVITPSSLAVLALFFVVVVVFCFFEIVLARVRKNCIVVLCCYWCFWCLAFYHQNMQKKGSSHKRSCKTNTRCGLSILTLDKMSTNFCALLFLTVAQGTIAVKYELVSMLPSA